MKYVFIAGSWTGIWLRLRPKERGENQNRIPQIPALTNEKKSYNIPQSRIIFSLITYSRISITLVSLSISNPFHSIRRVHSPSYLSLSVVCEIKKYDVSPMTQSPTSAIYSFSLYRIRYPQPFLWLCSISSPYFFHDLSHLHIHFYLQCISTTENISYFFENRLPFQKGRSVWTGREKVKIREAIWYFHRDAYIRLSEFMETF